MPSYYVVEDYHVAHDNAYAISKFNGPVKFIPRNYKHWIKPDKNTLYYNMNTGYYQEFSPPQDTEVFSRLLKTRLLWTICHNDLLAVSYYMGFQTVYLSHGF